MNQRIELKENKSYRENIIHSILKRLKYKIIVSLIFVKIIIMCLWYYETIFYSLYHYRKIQWTKCVILSFVYYISFLFILSILSFVLKMIGLKCHSQIFYNIYLTLLYLNQSNIISYFFPNNIYSNNS